MRMIKSSIYFEISLGQTYTVRYSSRSSNIMLFVDDKAHSQVEARRLGRDINQDESMPLLFQIEITGGLFIFCFAPNFARARKLVREQYRRNFFEQLNWVYQWTDMEQKVTLPVIFLFMYFLTAK